MKRFDIVFAGGEFRQRWQDGRPIGRGLAAAFARAFPCMTMSGAALFQMLYLECEVASGRLVRLAAGRQAGDFSYPC